MVIDEPITERNSRQSTNSQIRNFAKIGLYFEIIIENQEGVWLKFEKTFYII